MKELLDFKTLYFTDPTLDIQDVLTSVGLHVKVGSTEVLWAHNFSDLGSTPAELDCTPFSATQQMTKSGVVQAGQWTLDYWFNEDDFDALETVKSAGNSVTIEIIKGSVKLSNSGVLAANYLGGSGTNGVMEAHAVFNLSNPNGWTKSTVTP